MATTKRNVTIDVDGHTFQLDADWVLATTRWEGPPAGESSERLLAFLGLLLEDDAVETPKLPDDQAFLDRQYAALDGFAKRLPDVQELTGARWDRNGQRLTLKST